MKKKFTYFVAAVCAALTFSACSSDKLEAYSGQTLENPESPSNAISFGTYMGKTGITRAYESSYNGGAISNKAYDAADDGTTSLKKVGFGVFAYNSAYQKFGAWSSWDATTNSATQAPNFMYNEKLSWNTTKSLWDYSPVKYWPNGIDAANAANSPSNTATENGPQYLSFFAYAPYVGLSGGSDITSGVPTTPWAVTTAVPTTEDASGYGIVAMSKNSDAHDVQLKYRFGTAADETSAIDLLWGVRGSKVYNETDGENNSETTLGSVYNIDLTKQTVDEKVNFLFKHALARVGGSTSSSSASGTSQICGLKVVVDVDKNETSNSTTAADHSSQETYFTNNFDNEITLVTIKEVKIRDQYTYSQEPGSTITTTRSDFNTQGWFNIMKGQWNTTESNSTTHPNGVTYSVTAVNTASVDNAAPYALNDKIKEPTSAPTSSNISTNKWSYGDDYGVDLTAKNVYADENIPGLLLIPGSTGGNTFYITVDYFVRTADSKLATGFSEVEQIITNKVTLDNSVLTPNKYYTIVMHLGLTSVKFEAIVSDWQSKSDSNIDESGEETGGSTEIQQSIYLPSNVVSSTSTSLSGVNISTQENASVTIPASLTSYSITTTGKTGTLTAKVYTDATCETEASSPYAATVDGTDENKINVTLSANESSKNIVRYVKISDGGASKSSVITITQKAAPIGITTSYSPELSSNNITKDETTITLTIKENAGSGSEVDLTNASNTYTINKSVSAGTAISTVTATTTGATIIVPDHSGEDRTITYSVKVNDADVQYFTITQKGS